ncbi:MAG: hypothetical protein V3S21_00990 [Xanthomonadales bacterium]
MKRLIIWLLISTAALAQDERPVPPISLADLGEKAAVIVLAQVKDTDYFYRRAYPVSGSAYLKILIAYKIDRPMELIEVYEHGLHENECYFPNPTVFEEGRRYLLFLQPDPVQPERYRGLAEGCALDVLVEDDHRYALRYPVTGIDLADALEDLATELHFGDSYAIEDEDSLASTERNALLDGGWIVPFEAAKKKTAPGMPGMPPVAVAGRQWIYTHGIDLMTIRQMLGPMQDR